MQSSTGIRYSAFLHVLLLFFMVFGLPDFLHRKPDPEPIAISVEVLPIAPVSNVKPQEKAPEKIEEKKPPQEKVEKKATPPAHKDEPKPEPKPEPIPVKKPLPKKEEKKKPEKKVEEKKPDDDLDSILKNVAKTAKAEESKKPKEQTAAKPSTKPAKSDRFNAAMPLSMSETDAIRNQFIPCWRPPAGAKDDYNLAVTLRLEVNADGTVVKAELAKDTGRYNSDSFFRAAADAALRAANRCSPLKNLPADKFGTWHDMELTFDPKEMLY